MNINRTNLISLALLSLLLTGCQPVNEQLQTTINHKCIDSQSACVINNQAGSFSIKFNREPIIAEVDYQIAVKYNGLQRLKKLSAYIEGKNMYMGKIPVMFTKQGNMFIADSLLGSCSEEHMMWRLWITAEFEQSITEKPDTAVVEKQTFFIDFASQRF